jgi:hypothetical protein
LWVNGFVETYEQARERLLNDPDPDIAAWMYEKGLERRGRKDEYEFYRLWDWVRAKPKSYATTTMEEAMRLIADEAAQPGEDSAQEENGNEKEWFDDLTPIDPQPGAFGPAGIKLVRLNRDLIIDHPGARGEHGREDIFGVVSLTALRHQRHNSRGWPGPCRG